MNHFHYSCDINVWFRDNIVRRHKMPVALRVTWLQAQFVKMHATLTWGDLFRIIFIQIIRLSALTCLLYYGVFQVFSFYFQAPVEQTKCPLTLKDMVKPMKSKICGHNYEQDAILQHISRGRGRAKCPVCGQLLTKADLEHNAVLQHAIKRKNRRK